MWPARTPHPLSYRWLRMNRFIWLSGQFAAVNEGDEKEHNGLQAACWLELMTAFSDCTIILCNETTAEQQRDGEEKLEVNLVPQLYNLNISSHPMLDPKSASYLNTNKIPKSGVCAYRSAWITAYLLWFAPRNPLSAKGFVNTATAFINFTAPLGHWSELLSFLWSHFRL